MTLTAQLQPVFDLLADEAIAPALETLPLVGDDLSGLVASLDLDDLHATIDAAIATAEALADPAMRATAIAAALNDLDGISATATGTEITVTLTARTMAAVDIADGALAFGGSALSLAAQADFDGAITVDLDLSLVYDTATDTLALDGDADPEISLNAAIAADVAAQASMAGGFIAATLTDVQAAPEIEFFAHVNVTGMTPADVSVSYGGQTRLAVDLQTVVADNLLPGITARLDVTWNPLDPMAAPTLAFSDVGMTLGDLMEAVNEVLTPVTDILFEGIIGKIVTILTEPLPIIHPGLDAIGLLGAFDAIPEGGDGIFNLLDGLGLYFKAQNMTDAVAVLSAFAEALAFLKQLKEFQDAGHDTIALGDFTVGGGGGGGAASMALASLPALDFTVAEIDGKTPIEWLGDLADVAGLFSTVVDAIPGLSGAGPVSLSDATLTDDSGLRFPIIENPETIVNVLLPEIFGYEPVKLIEYDMPAISAEAQFGEYFFRIFGPFGLTIDGFAEATIDFQIGYDTYGLTTPGGTFLDGLYITTQEMAPGEKIERQPDDLQFEYRPIAYSSAGIFAGVAVDAVVVRVGVKGGIVGFVAAFLPGGEVDTAAGEVPNGVLRLENFGAGCFLDPILGRIGAEVVASIRVGYGIFSFEYDVTIADITLANFEFGCPPAVQEIDGLASVTGTGNLLLHVGPAAGLREIGGITGSDEAETYRISAGVDDDGAPVAGAIRVEYQGFFQNFGVEGDTAPDQIAAHFGQHDDALVISADMAKRVVADGGAGNDILEGAALDDALTGGDDDDRLFGRAGNDTLAGGAGNDYLEGGAGADDLDGGAGRDRVSYEASATGVSLAWNGSVIFGAGGDAQGDVLRSIEYLVGSAHDDVLTANPLGASTLQGNAGDDVLIGGTQSDFLLGDAGADLLRGNGGHDGTSYVTSMGAVRVDLASGAAQGGDAQGDVLVSIEDVMGSAFDDVLSGTAGMNRLAGWIGDDVIDGRGGADEITADLGADTVYAHGDGAALVDGGAGHDLLSYARAGGPVIVDLGAGTGRRVTNPANPDQIAHVIVDVAGEAVTTSRSSFEDLDGSAHDDALSGDEAANLIQGLAGDDTLNGAAGDDTLRGGAGADSLIGGAGTDWADYTDGDGVQIDLAGGTGSGSTAQGDRISGVENLRGSMGSDDLGGDDGDNMIAPMLSRAGSVDTVAGGAGTDTLVIDYAVQDYGRGAYGGLAEGALVRPAMFGTGVLDGVVFTGMERLFLTGTMQADSVTGGDLGDRFYLGGGDDTVDAGSGADQVFAQEGDDVVAYASGEAAPLFVLDGGRGRDHLSITLGNLAQDVVLRAGPGVAVNLTLASGAAAMGFEVLDDAQTGAGADRIEQAGRSDNHLRAGGNADVIAPGMGQDTVNGGDDLLTTGLESVDLSDRPLYIMTDPAQITLFTAAQGDRLVLDWGATDSAISSDLWRYAHSLAGYAGDNASLYLTNYSHSGRYETADGLDGVDFSAIEAVDVTGGAGDDAITGTWAGVEFALAYGDTTTAPATIATPKGNDTLRGGAGDDTLMGMTGSDLIMGGAGDDVIHGTDPGILTGASDDVAPDRQEIDTLTGGAGADLFVLGVRTPDVTGAGWTPQPFYLGRIGNDDTADNRAIITDFDAAAGDRLQLAGSAALYQVEAVAGGVNIVLAGETRDIIAHLEGLDALALDATTTRFLGSTIITPVIPPVITPPIILPPGPGGGFVLPAALGDGGGGAGLLAAPMLAGAASPYRAAPQPLLAEAPGVTPMAPAPAPMVAAVADDPGEMTDGPAPWVWQANWPTQLNASFFEGTTSTDLQGGTWTLEGDARAFGIFDGDPFGLGQGIVLSTGQVEDLDGTNEIDGGLYGPYAPELSFESIGEFGGSTIFRADLSFLATELNAITIADDGDGVGGGVRGYSGTEIDALVLSRQRLTAEDLAGGLDLNDTAAFQRLDVFDYSSAFSQFTPGTMRSGSGASPADFQGTSNGIIDLTRARLHEFAYGGAPGSGSFTLGDGGSVGFDLTESVDTDGPLYLYVAEGAANEALEAAITASDTRLAAPADLSTDFGAPGAADDLIRLTYTFDLDADAGKLLAFDYVLATEELREFAGTGFNDVFRISLNGVQMAQLSDGTAATVAQLLPAPFAAPHPDLVMNPVGIGPAAAQTRADAYTVPLHFMGRTQAGENTLVIEVQDLRDGRMDSAILIGSGSVQMVDDGATDALGPRIVTTPGDLVVTEGGAGVTVTLTLAGVAALGADAVVTLTPGSADIDLGAGPGAAHAVVFEAGGDLSASVTITAPIDGLDEPTEYVLAAISVAGGGVFDAIPVAPIVVAVHDAALPNRAPVANDVTYGTPEDNPINSTLAGYASDPDGDDLVFALASGPAHGTLVLAGDGGFTYTPDADWFGTDSFAYTVSDGALGATATASITVDPVNDAPRGTAPTLPATFEDAAPVSFDALATVYDVDNPASDLVVGAVTASWSGGALVASLAGSTIGFDPAQLASALAAGQSATVTISYAVSDGQDATGFATTLNVLGLDDAPPRALIMGTQARETLVGTTADEDIHSLGGRADYLFGGGGADVFVFNDETSNGVVEMDFIHDFGPDDALDLGGRAITAASTVNGNTYLTLDGDGDRIILLGVTGFDDALIIA